MDIRWSAIFLAQEAHSNNLSGKTRERGPPTNVRRGLAIRFAKYVSTMLPDCTNGLHKCQSTRIIDQSNGHSRPSYRHPIKSVKFKNTEKEESMRVYTNFGKVLMLATALLMMSFTLSFAKTNVDYKFKVHNNTTHDIKKILVSDDGKKWGYFDIVDVIKAGDTDELVWDKSTDNGACEWIFKAVWSNDEESEPVKFDFCEKGLTLEFTK